MSTADAWIYAANDAAPRPDDGWSQRPRYALADFITLLWRERFLMAAIFIVIVAGGIAYALTLNTKYTAWSSLIVSLGQEYVYEPRAGDAGRGAVPESDTVIAAEAEILGASPLKERVIDRIGLTVIYPDLADAPPGEAMAKAVRTMEKSLMINTAADVPAIRLGFEHENPVMAARVLNTLVEEYQDYRREVLIPSAAPALQAQRLRSEDQLSATDAQLQAFLSFNNIGDFEATKTALSESLTELEQQRSTTATQLREQQRRLSSVESQLAATPREDTVYRDESVAARQSLDTLRQQRAELLATYLPGSIPVQRIDEQIAELEAALAGTPNAGDVARRIGPNPVYQTLATERATVTANVAALREQLDAINDQIDLNTQRYQELTQLEPQFQSLTRERDILQSSVRDFSTRERESLADAAIAEQTTDNVRVVGEASVPLEGSSQRKIVAALAVILGGLTALAVGLLRILLRPGLPTASSAGRTLDLPVLGAARARR